MRASGGRSRTSPKRTTKGPVSSTWEGEEAQDGGVGNTKRAEVMVTAPEKPIKNPMEEDGIGSSANSGLQSKGHQCSPMILGDVETSLENSNRNKEGNGTEVLLSPHDVETILTFMLRLGNQLGSSVLGPNACPKAESF
nr:hypothetical protein CFP56_27630 [Quercus suber]